LWAYEGVARKLIKQAKYKFYYDHLEGLINSLSQSLSQRTEFTYFNRFLEERPVIVPVPLWPRRERERGFNQAEVIGRLVASRWSLEMKNLLLRVRDTGRQVGRTKEERLEAMKGAFAINSKYEILKSKQIPNSKFQFPKSVLLVDDVWTTGATMNECTKVLKQAGVRRVWGVVLAR
jgi:ComF family protein